MCRRSVSIGTLEEQKLMQMVRDYIEISDTPASRTSVLNSSCAASSISLDLKHETSHLFRLQTVLGSVTNAEAEILEKVGSILGSAAELVSSRVLNELVAMRLGSDHGYNASVCRTSWPATSGCPPGEYEYVEVAMVSNNGYDENLARILIDMDFRSQFELARTTTWFKELIEFLPNIFVGTEEKLRTAIPVLCTAMADALTETGLYIPPWRKQAFIKSKWLSKHVKRFITNSAKDGLMPNENVGYAAGSGSSSCSFSFGKWVPPKSKSPRKIGGCGLGRLSNFKPVGMLYK